MFLEKKNLFYLMVFSVLIFGIMSSVDAFSIHKADKNTVRYIYNESTITVSIISTDLTSELTMNKDLNSINKIVVKVNGKTVNVIKKGKGWYQKQFYPLGIIDRETKIQGNIKGKKVSILTYDNKNKLIKKQSNVVKSVRTSDFTKAQINIEAINILKGMSKYWGNTSVTKVGSLKYDVYTNLWHVEYVNIKTGKFVGRTWISGETGEIANM